MLSTSPQTALLAAGWCTAAHLARCSKPALVMQAGPPTAPAAAAAPPLLPWGPAHPLLLPAHHPSTLLPAAAAPPEGCRAAGAGLPPHHLLLRPVCLQRRRSSEVLRLHAGSSRGLRWPLPLRQSCRCAASARGTGGCCPGCRGPGPRALLQSSEAPAAGQRGSAPAALPKTARPAPHEAAGAPGPGWPRVLAAAGGR